MFTNVVAPPEWVDLGVEIEPELSTDAIWAVLLEKIEQPDRFLPVKDISCRQSDDGKGTYLEMTTTFHAATGRPEQRVIENIYSYAEPTWEVVFEHTYDDDEVVNKIQIDGENARRLEFFLRNKITKERVNWQIPKAIGINGIRGVLEMARTNNSAGI